MGRAEEILSGSSEYWGCAVTTENSYKIVVSVGTDHHLFDRLIDWVDHWMEKQDEAPSCFVQHGASRTPKYGTAKDRLPREDLLDIYRGAELVVVQGGPGSILDAREIGAVPLAVPRAPWLKEVVDGHQIEFTKVMAKHGNAHFVDNEEHLHQMMDRVLANPEQYRTAPRVADPQAAGFLLSAAIDTMHAEKSRGLRKILRRTTQLLPVPGRHR